MRPIVGTLIAGGVLTLFIHALGQDAKGDLYIVRVDQSSTSQLDNGAIFQVTP